MSDEKIAGLYAWSAIIDWILKEHFDKFPDISSFFLLLHYYLSYHYCSGAWIYISTISKQQICVVLSFSTPFLLEILK